MTDRSADRPLDLADRLALRPREAADALGVSERTVRALLPELPHVREGGVVLIPVDLLREWLRERANAERHQVDKTADGVLEALSTDD